jgi:tetratricopeptide (TPR) repeat protein
MRQIVNFLLLWIVSASALQAQQYTDDYKPDPKFAKFCIQFNNYTDGLKEYKMLLADDPDNVDYRHGAGICYLHLNQDKKKALEYLEWVVQQKKYEEQAHYDLGWAYLQNYRLDKAEKQFKLYLSLVKEDKNRIPATRMLEMCANARLAMSNPAHVEITNLGKYVNSEYPDFNPFVPADESILIFNSQRKSNLGNFAFYDGFYPSDVYMSTYKFGKWKKTRRLPASVNSSNIEKVVGMTSDGLNLFVIQEDIKGNKQTFYTQKRGRHYRDLEPIFIQDVRYEKIHSLTISPNKRYLIFSADRKDGIGGKDLYMSFRLPNGYWSSAQLLDSTINTPYDEDFPYFSPDGSSFFFASEGHNSMGGYDIFKSNWNSEDSAHISGIKNLGYPVNTTLDDLTISFSRSGRYAYISTFRENGEGDLDIYRVIFKEQTPKYSVVYGYIYNQDSVLMTQIIQRMNEHIDTLNFPINHKYKDLLLKKKDSVAAFKVLATKIPYEEIDVSIQAINQENGEVFGHFIAKNRTAKYTVILPPGKWKLVFTRDGYQETVIRDIEIEERDKRNKLIQRNVTIRELN